MEGTDLGENDIYKPAPVQAVIPAAAATYSKRLQPRTLKQCMYKNFCSTIYMRELFSPQGQPVYRVKASPSQLHKTKEK